MSGIPKDSETDSVSDDSKPIGIVARFSLALTQLLLLTLVCTTMLALLARGHWFADLLANLRMQQLIALVVVFLLCAAHRRRSEVIAAAVLVAIHLPSFASALPPRDRAGDDANESITITLANVLTQNLRHDDIVADVTRRDPDVIAIVELSTALATKLRSEIGETYPYSLVRPQDTGSFGIGLFSRVRFHDEEVIALNLGIESLAATVSVGDQDYRIFATHPLPPMGPAGFAARNEHLKQLAERIKQFRTPNPDVPVILVGDLNVTPWSPHFTALERNSDLIRARDGFDVTPTWYRFEAFPFGLVLDHALISSQLKCVSHEVGPRIGSDHRSVTCRISRRSH